MMLSKYRASHTSLSAACDLLSWAKVEMEWFHRHLDDWIGGVQMSNKEFRRTPEFKPVSVSQWPMLTDHD